MLKLEIGVIAFQAFHQVVFPDHVNQLAQEDIAFAVRSNAVNLVFRRVGRRACLAAAPCPN
jgi:hypothetical protein